MSGTDEDRIAAILGEWYAAQESDDPLGVEEFIAAHPELADELRLHFELLEAAEQTLSVGAPATQPMPHQIGEFRLLRELGSGGMGTVYLAESGDTEAGDSGPNQVAIKVVHPHLFARPGFFKRFLREAEAGRRVRHTNVVSTLDADAREVAGNTTLYLVMEYVEGRTLRDLLEDLRVVPEALLREIARQLAEGLAAIHAEGIVHRDLKPDNVIITDAHEVRIMDLGIARLVSDEGALSEQGQFTGSLHYASPEQFGDADVGAAADLYALGVTLYELATGSNPFRRDDAAAVVRAHLDYEPKDVDEVDPNLSRFLGQVVTTLLAKDPTARFASAHELRAVLDEGPRSDWWRDRELALLKSMTRLPQVPVRRETKVLGREAHLEALHEAWARAKRGEGNFVLLDGEAGIGKSRLVDAFLRDVVTREPELEIHALYGSHPPSSGTGALADAVVRQFGEATNEDALRPYLVETPTLVPAFAALLRHDALPDGAAALAGDSLPAAFCHLMRALAAERPLIWVVEDLHFATGGSDNVFLSLARALPGHRILLVGSTRPGLSQDLLTSFGRLEHYQRLTLERLGAREVVLLLQEALRSEALAERLGGRIALRSDGIPFFVFEMIRGLREGQFITRLPDGSYIETREIERIEVPGAVRDLVEARLRDLTKNERAVLDVGAVQGYEFDPDLVARVVARTRFAVLEDLAGIERRSGIVRATGVAFRFDHHQIQEVIGESLPEALRRECHTLLAEARVDREAAAASATSPAAGYTAHFVASHHLRGRRPESALPFIKPAIEHLAGEYRDEELVEIAELALAVPRLLEEDLRVEVLLRLEDSLDRLGDRERQEEVIHTAMRLAQKLENPALRWSTKNVLGLFLDATSRTDEAQSVCREALSLARAHGERHWEAASAGNLGNLLRSLGELDESREQLELQRSLSRELGIVSFEATATAMLGNTAVAQGCLEEARELQMEALALHTRMGDRAGIAQSCGRVGSVLTVLSRHERARYYLDRSLKLCREIGARQGEADTTGVLGDWCSIQGRYEEACAHYSRALAVSSEMGDRPGEAESHRYLGDAYCSLGRLVEAREHNERSRVLCEEVQDRDGEAQAELGRGRLLQFQSLHAEARSCDERAVSQCRKIGSLLPQVRGISQLGQVAVSLGDLQEAWERYQESLSLSRQAGFHRGEVDALSKLGTVAWIQGDGANCLKYLQTAICVSEEHGVTEVIAPAHLTLARTRLEGGDAESGHDSLRQARDLAVAWNLCSTEIIARCELALLRGGDPRGAIAKYEEFEERLSASDRCEACWMLWRVTGERDYLATAKRLLDEALSKNPAEFHAAMCTNCRVNREIVVAWDALESEADHVEPGS